MNTADLTTLPDSPLCRYLLAYVRSAEASPIAAHSIRSYLFARLLAASTDRDDIDAVDDELLFAACALHDIGLTAAGDRRNRFEIDGADTAAQLLTDQGMAAPDVDAVWDAIALHSSGGLAPRRSALCATVQAGIWADFGTGIDRITEAEGIAIHRAYPRAGLVEVLADLVVEQARRTPSKAPRYSLADTMLLERDGPTGRTRMERDEPTSRWAGLTLE